MEQDLLPLRGASANQPICRLLLQQNNPIPEWETFVIAVACFSATDRAFLAPG